MKLINLKVINILYNGKLNFQINTQVNTHQLFFLKKNLLYILLNGINAKQAILLMKQLKNVKNMEI